MKTKGLTTFQIPQARKVGICPLKAIVPIHYEAFKLHSGSNYSLGAQAIHD